RRGEIVSSYDWRDTRSVHRRADASSSPALIQRSKTPLQFANRHTRLAEVLSHDNAIPTMLSSTDFVSIDCALDMSPQRQTAMDRLAIRTRPSDIRPTSTRGRNQ